MALPGISRELNPAALDQYLCYGYIPHPHTIYRNIFKLPPAHYAIFEDGKLEIRRVLVARERASATGGKRARGL